MEKTNRVEQGEENISYPPNSQILSSAFRRAVLCATSLQLCPTLCSPMDCSPPGSSVHGILQARVLGRVSVPSFRGSSQPRDLTHVSCIGKQGLYHSCHLGSIQKRADIASVELACSCCFHNILSMLKKISIHSQSKFNESYTDSMSYARLWTCVSEGLSLQSEGLSFSSKPAVSNFTASKTLCS